MSDSGSSDARMVGLSGSTPLDDGCPDAGSTPWMMDALRQALLLWMMDALPVRLHSIGWWMTCK